MNVTIRHACAEDRDAVMELLSQVLELHANIRPDIFVPGSTKYTDRELLNIFENDQTPVFVACDEEGRVVGYVFCQIRKQPFSTNMKDFRTLFMDDLCVDQSCRGAHVGRALFEYAKRFAKENGCYDLTLNVWEGNDNAIAFYRKMGMFVKETQMEMILD